MEVLGGGSFLGTQRKRLQFVHVVMVEVVVEVEVLALVFARHLQLPKRDVSGARDDIPPPK